MDKDTSDIKIPASKDSQDLHKTPEQVSSEQERKFRAAPKLNKSPFHGLWALTNRDLRKWYTNPAQLIISLITPIVWLGLFGKALNFSSFIAQPGIPIATQNAILLSYFGTTSYFSFLSCGMRSEEHTSE